MGRLAALALTLLPALSGGMVAAHTPPSLTARKVYSLNAYGRGRQPAYEINGNAVHRTDRLRKRRGPELRIAGSPAFRTDRYGGSGSPRSRFLARTSGPTSLGAAKPLAL